MRRRIAIGAPLALAIGLAAAGAPVTGGGHAAQGAEPAGDLLYVQSRSPGLFSIRADGRDIRRLTSARDEGPALSPDGSRLAFVRTRDGGRTYELYVATASGGSPRRITSARGFAQAPTWTGDGAHVVFSASGGRWGTSKDPSCAPNLWIVRPDGGGPRRLVRRGVQPALSPGGRRLAFVRPDRREREWLYVARADGGGVKRLGRGSHPSWSPDGRRLVVERWSGPDRMADLWSVRVSDGRATRLTWTAGLSEVDPAWSPDGDRIAFSMFRGGRQEIYAIPPAGGEAVAITRSSRDAGLQQPAWRP
jgi:Tol biopolymer transport system component